MFTMTGLETMIVIIVVSFCMSVIVGTLIYCILKKKHDEDTEWLFNMICNNKTEVGRFYNKYAEHMAKYH